ncbi:DUF6145 family protein [Petrocella sp. FN5]|uniref:DUF6145 family protein n=1 Tax=Petrocella sp. FN5 TaxID=3032002 RepID=UPI0023DAA5CC|nr:DUF6145 family protein [Petrocella sp. FN5]MDF1617353.1 DUF6145 family protein [Petrocella sp. FN5]
MEEIVLAAASSYDRKYYFNKEFDTIPDDIKTSIQIMLVSFTMEIGGLLSLVYDEDGLLYFRTECDEEDILYDEIGAHLKIKKMMVVHQDLLEGLQLFYKVFYLGESLE